MAITRTSPDYTTLDFDSARRRAFDLVRSARPEWTDESVASIGNLLLEVVAHAVDLLAYNINAEGLESFIATATRRESIIALGQIANYKLSTASAATVEVKVTLEAEADTDVSIPAGTFVRTSDTFDVTRFQILEELIILAGETEGTADAENSEDRQKTTEATGIPDLDVTLDESPFLDGSLSVSSTGQGAYTQVDSFLSSGSEDLHYVVLVDARDRATVRFGDGVNGKPPTGTLTFGYKIGGGADGNVEAGKINVLEAVIVDTAGTVLRGSVTNELQASGGSDRETLEEARLAIPEWIRAAGNRSVTEEDFENGARSVNGVARALMLTSEIDEAIGENEGLILVVPDGGGEASDTLLDAVVEEVTVTRPTMPTFLVRAESAIYVDVDVEARVYFEGTSKPTEVANDIRTAVASWFAIELDDGTPNPDIDFGFRLEDNVIAWSDVFNVARDIDGVQRIKPGDFKLGGLSGDFTLANREFPILGDVTIYDASSGQVV